MFFSKEKAEPAVDAEPVDILSPEQNPQEKNVNPTDSDNESIDKDLQYGIQIAKAVNRVWTKNELIFAYVLMWFIQFMQAYCQGTMTVLNPYIYSSFALQSLVALTSVISSLVGGLFRFPYAKIIDIWGRAQGFTIMIVAETIGIIMMAACKDVKTYCAAQVFFWLGYDGINFSMTIFIADTSALKNRGFWLAYASSAFLITTWITGPTATSILNNVGLRWGYGIFAIVMPVVQMPLALLFLYNQRKAEKLHLVERPPSGRTWKESIIYYGREFDVIGLLILATGLALFLLAFNLYSYQKNQWASPMIICFVVIGFVLILVFTAWERFWAPVKFMPWYLISNRTVIFTYTMAGAMYMAFYVWDSYFYSMLVVVFNQSVTHATYISNTYTMGSCSFSFVVGAAIKYTGRLKWWAMYFGVPITMLGSGLMIYFRQPDVNIGYIVMCQIFIAFGGAALVLCEQMTVMAVSKQEDIPAIIAMESAIISITSAIGSTVATAMWTGIFPDKLYNLLPDSSKGDFAAIYGSIDVQTSYAMGTETRTAINQAYGDTQRLMCIASTCMYAISLISVIFWKDIDVRKIKQIAGLHL